MAGLQVEALFTAALGLAEPWKVDKVEFNTAKRRIDFEVVCTARRLVCPACGKTSQAAVPLARERQDMGQVSLIGIDETSAKRGQSYITVVHDLHAKRLLFATPGRDHGTVERFAQDLRAHGGQPEHIDHVCMDMSAAYALGVRKALANAQISYDRLHAVALANEAMDQVRSAEWKGEGERVGQALGQLDARERRRLLWAMRRNPQG